MRTKTLEGAEVLEKVTELNKEIEITAKLLKGVFPEVGKKR